MAQRKITEPQGENRRSIAQKARRAKELNAISKMADENAAVTDEWRVLLPEHMVAIKVRLLNGDTLGNACRDLGIERGVVNQYVFDNPEFAREILAFKAYGAHGLYERLIEMIDDDTMSASDKMFAYKVISNYAPKINKEVYSDSIQVDQTVTHNTPVMPDWFFGNVVDGQLSDGSDPTI